MWTICASVPFSCSFSLSFTSKQQRYKIEKLSLINGIAPFLEVQSSSRRHFTPITSCKPWHLGSQLPFWEFDFHTEAVVFHDSNQAQQPFYQQPVSHKTMKLLIKLKKLSFTGVLVPTMTIPVKRFEMYFRVTWSDQPRNSSVQLPAVVSEQEPLFGDWKSCDQNVVGYT